MCSASCNADMLLYLLYMLQKSMLSDSDSIKRTPLKPIAPEKVSVKAEKLVDARCPACSCVLETFPGNEAYCSSCQRGLRPHPFSCLHSSLPLRRASMPLWLRRIMVFEA